MAHLKSTNKRTGEVVLDTHGKTHLLLAKARNMPYANHRLTGRGEVVPYTFWRQNIHPHRIVSAYGAHPGAGFSQIRRGYTILWDDGSVGLPIAAKRKSFDTRKEAEDFLKDSIFGGFR